jgi:hypothetical protein
MMARVWWLWRLQLSGFFSPALLHSPMTLDFILGKQGLEQFERFPKRRLSKISLMPYGAFTDSGC